MWGMDMGLGIPISWACALTPEAAPMTTSARDIAETFDGALTGGALALGSILIEQRQMRQADRAEAAAIHRQAAAIRARKATAALRDLEARQAADRRFAHQRQTALIAARRAILAG